MSELGTVIKDSLIDVFGIDENISSILTLLIVIVVWILIGFIIMFAMKQTLRKIFNIRKGDNRTLTIGKLINSITKYIVSFVILFLDIL